MDDDNCKGTYPGASQEEALGRLGPTLKSGLGNWGPGDEVSGATES